jgi:probable addiction module antidote protein
MARQTRPWDAAATLKTREDVAAYLDAVLDDGDPDLLKAALGDIARAEGMTEIARAAGVGRANLYKALSPDGNPELATVAKVLRALGLRLTVAAHSEPPPRRRAGSRQTRAPQRKQKGTPSPRVRRGAR